MNKTVSKVFKYCEDKQLLRAGMTVVAGVSGGADSVCLIRILLEISVVMPLNIYAVHIEHGIRGEESKQDMEYVKSLCKELNVPLSIYEINVPAYAEANSMTLEEAGRYVRYDAFEKEAAKVSADVIAVAHHMNDQAETVLFNMVRGSGLKGLSGIAGKRDNIIRPLLILSREEIEEYLDSIGQEYCIDATNKDTDYSRNCIRNIVLPKLDEVVEGAALHIARAADEIREANDYIYSQAADVYPKTVTESENGDYIIDVSGIVTYPEIVRRYIVRIILKKLYKTHKDLESVHVKDILSLVDKQSGRSVDLPKNISARRSLDRIIVGCCGESKLLEMKPVNIECKDQSVVELPNGDQIDISIFPYEKSMTIPSGLYTKWLDYDKISDSLQLRNRRSGDYLIFDEKGSVKKLKKYLIDEKVPKEERDKLCVIAEKSHVLWVPGMRISEYYKISSDTKIVIEFRLRRMS